MGFRFWSATVAAALVAIISTDCFAGEKLFTCITPKHTIEVQQSDGGGSVSYRSWNAPATTTSPPNLAIENGTVETDDSQGGATLHLYKFHLTNTDILVSDGPLLSGSPSAKSGEIKVFINGQERSHYECAPPATVAPAASQVNQSASDAEAQATPAQAAPPSESPTPAPATASDTPKSNSSSFLAAAAGGIVVLLIILGIIGAFLYFIPTIIAFNRKHRQKWVIFAINFFLGATAIGWFVALIWALSSDEKSQNQTIIIQQANTNHNPPFPAAQNVVATVAPEPMAAPAPMPPASQSPPSSQTSPGPSVISEHQIDELTRLGALRDSGVLTQEEFDSAKRKILGI